MNQTIGDLNSSLLDKTVSGEFSTIARYSIGSIYLIMSVILCSLYIMTMYLMATDKAECKFSYHKIILSLSLFDMVQIFLMGFVGGVFTFVENVPFWINKILGGILNSCWFVSCANGHLLAFNRFMSVIFSEKSKIIFSKNATSAYILATWLYGLVWIGVFMYPGYSMVFYKDGLCWGYDDTPLSQLGSQVEISVDLTNLACMAFWYLAVYFYLKTKVRNPKLHHVYYRDCDAFPHPYVSPTNL